MEKPVQQSSEITVSAELPSPKPAKKKVSGVEKARLKLLDCRAKLLGHSNGVTEGGISGDAAELAFASEADALAFKLEGNKSIELRDVDRALLKIMDGTYGRCEMCMRKIPKARMVAKPEARMCVPCQQEIDEGKKELPEYTPLSFENSAETMDEEMPQRGFTYQDEMR